MQCKFAVGQKVVCQPFEPWHFVNGPSIPALLPMTGKIYTIASIKPYGCDVYLCFEEFPNWIGYDHRQFRALRQRPQLAQTDISVFSPLLRAKELENA